MAVRSGPQPCDDLGLIERLHLRFCKLLLRVNKSTASNMVYGELGRFPLSILSTLRVLGFWYKLIKDEDSTKLSTLLYKPAL